VKPRKVNVRKSRIKGKKYVARFTGQNGKTKTTHFGGKGYEDYTIHKDPKRKNLYLQRHQTRENWNDPTTAGSLSKHILWNKPNLQKSFNDYKNRFNLEGSIKPRSYFRTINGTKYNGSPITFTNKTANQIAGLLRNAGRNTRIIPAKRGYRIYTSSIRKYSKKMPSREKLDEILSKKEQGSDYGWGEGGAKINPMVPRTLNEVYNQAPELSLQTAQLFATGRTFISDIESDIFTAYENAGTYGYYISDVSEYIMDKAPGFPADEIIDGEKIDRNLLSNWLLTLSPKDAVNLATGVRNWGSFTQMSNYFSGDYGYYNDDSEAPFGDFWAKVKSPKEAKYFKQEEIEEIFNLQNNLREEAKELLSKDLKLGDGRFGEAENFLQIIKEGELGKDYFDGKGIYAIPVNTLKLLDMDGSGRHENDGNYNTLDGEIIGWRYTTGAVRQAQKDIMDYRDGKIPKNPAEMFFFANLGSGWSVNSLDLLEPNTMNNEGVKRDISALDWYLDGHLDMAEEREGEELNELQAEYEDNIIAVGTDVAIFKENDLLGFYRPPLGDVSVDEDTGFTSMDYMDDLADQMLPDYADYDLKLMSEKAGIQKLIFRGSVFGEGSSLDMGGGDVITPAEMLMDFDGDVREYIIRTGGMDQIKTSISVNDAKTIKDWLETSIADNLDDEILEVIKEISQGKHQSEYNDYGWGGVYAGQVKSSETLFSDDYDDDDDDDYDWDDDDD
tara:strand:+ start:16710 stop:18887 length:2178 start_codon:yes stop_codon:yes gene_type:complete